MGLSADVDIDPETDLFGKTISDFEENIRIRGDRIRGTLKYIDDYSSAGYVGDEAYGNYLVLHFSVPNVEGVTIQATINNRTVTLDEDGILISHIADKSSQTLTVVASKDGYDSVTKNYALSDLTVKTE